MGTTLNDLVHMPVFYTLVGIPEVDTREKHQKLFGADKVGFIIGIRPGEAALFQPFLRKPESVAVPPETFDEFLLPIAEEIKTP